MKMLFLFIPLTLMVVLSGCTDSKKIKYIFPNDYTGYHVFIESSDAEKLAVNGRMTTIMVPEGRISFIPSFSVFSDWHIVEAERKNGKRILVDDGHPDANSIRLYSSGDAGVLLNGEKRVGYYVFLGDSKKYESFREYKAKNNIDPNFYYKLPDK